MLLVRVWGVHQKCVLGVCFVVVSVCVIPVAMVFVVCCFKWCSCGALR